jgi:hypothetical protein
MRIESTQLENTWHSSSAVRQRVKNQKAFGAAIFWRSDITTHSTQARDSLSFMMLPLVVNCRWRAGWVNSGVMLLVV